MRTLTLLVFAILSIWSYGQDTGIIIYEEKVNIHRQLPPSRQQYKDMIPEFRTSKYELHYTTTESMFTASKEQDIPEGGQRWMSQMPQRDVYKNLEEDKMVDSREFMTKKFLIRGESEQYTWKVADGQKTIQDFMCIKAVYQDSAGTFTAWFTPQIQISNGPAEFGGLPGMILQLDINDEERVLTAIEIRETEVDLDMLKEPKKGKEVTSDEFREIVAKKMREMRQQRGGGTSGKDRS